MKARTTSPAALDGPISAADELVVRGAPVKLRDGSRVRLRQACRTDRDLLLAGFARLSPESRYRRFLSPMGELGEKTLRYLTEIDHHDHEAIVALDERGDAGIGVARYVRDPMRPECAEVAVTVVDEWQGRGLGTLLLDVLSVRARQEGIGIFTALMLARNEQMMDLFEQLGPVRIVGRGAGTVEIEVAIPDLRTLSGRRPS
jgi:GNAT superfamily N-acetyltransferase